MSSLNDNVSGEGLLDLAIDPEVLAYELAAELAGDPLDELDCDNNGIDEIKVASECEKGLKWLQMGHEYRLQGLRIFCEYRDSRALPFLVPLLQEPCAVERMSAVYALGRNPCPRAVEILLNLLQKDSNAYVRKACAWSLGNYSNAPVLQPLLSSLQFDVAAVRIWAASSLAEVGLNSVQNAEAAAIQLFVSMRVDSEPIVRSNSIWALGRLYEKLNQCRKEQLFDALFDVLLNDCESSVRDEAQIALEQFENSKVQARIDHLTSQGEIV